MKSAAHSAAVTKAMRLLGVLATADKPMSSSELAEALGLPKSTVVDLCSVLEEERYAKRGSDGHFEAADRFVSLSRGLFLGKPVLESFHQLVRTLPLAGQSTIILSVLDDRDISIAGVSRGQSVLPITAKVGLCLPSWSSASGLALLSRHTLTELSEHLSYYSATSIVPTEPKPAPKELFETIRSQSGKGYFVDRERTVLGMCGISAPVFLEGAARPVAAVTIAIPEQAPGESTPEELGATVSSLAARLSKI